MKLSYDDKTIKTGKDALKKIALIFLNFIVFWGLLHLIILLSDTLRMMWIFYVGMTLYGILLGVLFVVFYVMNGFTFDGKEKTEEDLTDEWDHKQKREYLEKLKVSRAKAKKLIYFILPLVMTIAVYYIEINFLS
ncbi:MAG: hypothetical protein E7672_00575 [Ruminococcaceae bacterium]|nr:hypothetical protein [Oscillospiraceae bacterium]